MTGSREFDPGAVADELAAMVKRLNEIADAMPIGTNDTTLYYAADDIDLVVLQFRMQANGDDGL